MRQFVCTGMMASILFFAMSAAAAKKSAKQLEHDFANDPSIPRAYATEMKNLDDVIAKAEEKDGTCRKQLSLATRKLLYSRFQHENQGVGRKAARAGIGRYVELAYLGCAESNGKPVMFSPHGGEATKGLNVSGNTLTDFDNAMAMYLKNAEDGKDMYVKIGKRLVARSPDRWMNEQFNHGPYQISADRNLYEPTKSLIRGRVAMLQKFESDNSIAEYCGTKFYFAETDVGVRGQSAVARVRALLTPNEEGIARAVAYRGPELGDVAAKVRRQFRVEKKAAKTADEKKAVDAKIAVAIAETKTKLRAQIADFGELMTICPAIGMEASQKLGYAYYGSMQNVAGHCKRAEICRSVFNSIADNL